MLKKLDEKFDQEQFAAGLSNVRKATGPEAQGVLEFYIDHLGLTDLDDLPPISGICVIDKSVSDGPGYTGPAFYITFSGGVQFINILTINEEGRLTLEPLNW